MSRSRLLLIALLLLLSLAGCNRPQATPTSGRSAQPFALTPNPLPTRPPLTPTATPTPPSTPTATPEATSAVQGNPLATRTTPPPASATDEPESIAGWAYVSVLNAPLRKTISDEPTAILHAGQRLDILAATADRAWLFVRWQPQPDAPPQTGWVRAEDVQYFIDPQDIPVLSPGGGAASASATPAPTLNQGQVTARTLNLRAGPGIDQPILGKLHRGDSIQLLGRTTRSQWLRVRTQQGLEGWVARRWITTDIPVQDLPVLAQATTHVPIPASGPQGLILFQDRPGGTIYLIRADGTGLRPLTTGLDPAFSPDGRSIAFTRWQSQGDGVWVISVDGQDAREVVRVNKPRSPTWSPDGQSLTFDTIRESKTCRITPFGCLTDQELRDRFHGHDCWTFPPPIGQRCIDDFQITHIDLMALQTVHLDGTHLRDLPASSSARAPRHHPSQPHILHLTREGLALTFDQGDTSPQPLVDYPYLGAPIYSPDGQFIYVSRKDGDCWNIWRYRADGSQPVALTHPPLLRDRPIHAVAPAVSPDGRYILFLTNRRGPWELWIMRSDGTQAHPFAPQALTSIPFQFDFGPTRMIDWR